MKINLLISIFIFVFGFQGFTQSNWEFQKETYLKGSINGTVNRGFVFKVSTNEVYIVNDATRQRVRLRNPNVKIYQKGLDYLLVIDGVDEPVVCRQLKNFLISNIDGEFTGWDGETVFKLRNGQYWQQSAYAYLYQYSYSPEVLIYEFGGEYFMRVEDVEEAVNVKRLGENGNSQTSDVISSRIDGDFEGWEGDTIFKLQNGQIWQQVSYSYHYHYSFSPQVLIFKSSGGFEMKVEGIQTTIKVKRLK